MAERTTSSDRHIASDTRFSRGMWENKAGVSIKWAQDTFKTLENESGIYNVSTTHPLPHRGGQLNNPTITTKLFSPSEGIVGVEHYHHLSRYINSNEPKFDLNEKNESGHFKTETTESLSTLLVDGGISASIQNQNWGIEFKNEDKLLTKLGFRSVGWVSDSRYPKEDGSPSTYTQFQLHVSNGEKFFGLGERFGPFVKNGQRVEMWNEDGGTSSEWTYKNIPFFLSSRGYGVFVDSPGDVIFEIQSERTTRVNITVPAEGVKYYIINGPDPKSILARYASLTGFPALPPAWTFGLWLTTSFTTDYDINTVSSFIQGMKDREIPLRTFHFDCFWMKGLQWCDFQFDPEFFPDPKKMLAELKEKFGIKVCVWINSYIAQESSLFKECDEKGYLIKNVDGSSYQTDLWQAGMGIIDYTNPEAYSWYQDQLSRLVDLGVDSFKTDFGERIPVKGVKYHSGQDPVAMHNYYTLLYNKCVFELLEKKLGKNEACLFARSATTGGQQFPVHWGGDCESTFEAMAETLRGGLSLTLSGFGFWSHDISGFEGSPDPALYKRWCAFGLLSSHSRLHGSASYRVPWNFDEESSVVLKKFTHLKLSLMPYIYAKAIEAHKTATPVQRALLLEFFDDKVASQVDDAFMLGDSILVAPVTSEDGVIEYYIPKGNWYGYLDGEVRSSTGQYFTETHDFKSVPMLIRPNSVFVSTGLDAPNDMPDFDYCDDVLVNLYDLEDGQHVVEIPDINNLGEFSGEVRVKKYGDSIFVEASNVKKLSVRLLGIKTVKNGDDVSVKDEFGNVVIQSSNGTSVTVDI